MHLIEKVGVVRPVELPIVDRTQSLNYAEVGINLPSALIIHSTRSYPEFEALQENHLKRGFAGVGYHFFVANSARIYQARPIFVEGAHALGFNRKSLGISFYAPEEKLPKDAKNRGIQLINVLQSLYGPMPLLSHTQTQLIYLNDLLTQAGRSERLPVDTLCVRPEKFKSIQQEADKLVGILSTEPNLAIKIQLKKLKNCPGPFFEEIINGCK